MEKVQILSPLVRLLLMVADASCVTLKRTRSPSRVSNNEDKAARVTLQPEEDTSTVCSPSTPALNKFSQSFARYNRGSPVRPTRSNHSSDSAVASPSRSYPEGISSSLAQEIEQVIRLLWNRDDMTEHLSHSPYTPQYTNLRRKSLTYIKMYLSSLGSLPDDLWPILLAGIFLAFKSADYIPGKGRVRMNQLLDAYDRTTAFTVDDLFIQAICRIELKMMCLCDFQFD